MVCLLQDLLAKGCKLTDLKEQIAFYHLTTVSFVLLEDVVL